MPNTKPARKGTQDAPRELAALKGMRSRIALYRDGKGTPQPVEGGWYKGEVVPPKIKHGERIRVMLLGQARGQFENTYLKLPCEGWLEACEIDASGYNVTQGAFRIGDGKGAPGAVMHPKFRRL